MTELDKEQVLYTFMNQIGHNIEEIQDFLYTEKLDEIFMDTFKMEVGQEPEDINQCRFDLLAMVCAFSYMDIAINVPEETREEEEELLCNYFENEISSREDLVELVQSESPILDIVLERFQDLQADVSDEIGILYNLSYYAKQEKEIKETADLLLPKWQELIAYILRCNHVLPSDIYFYNLSECYDYAECEIIAQEKESVNIHDMEITVTSLDIPLSKRIMLEPQILDEFYQQVIALVDEESLLNRNHFIGWLLGMTLDLLNFYRDNNENGEVDQDLMDELNRHHMEPQKMIQRFLTDQCFGEKILRYMVPIVNQECAPKVFDTTLDTILKRRPYTRYAKDNYAASYNPDYEREMYRANFWELDGYLEEIKRFHEELNTTNDFDQLGEYIRTHLDAADFILAHFYLNEKGNPNANEMEKQLVEMMEQHYKDRENLYHYLLSENHFPYLFKGASKNGFIISQEQIKHLKEQGALPIINCLNPYYDLTNPVTILESLRRTCIEQLNPAEQTDEFPKYQILFENQDQLPEYFLNYMYLSSYRFLKVLSSKDENSAHYVSFIEDEEVRYEDIVERGKVDPEFFHFTITSAVYFYQLPMKTQLAFEEQCSMDIRYRNTRSKFILMNTLDQIDTGFQKALYNKNGK